MNAPVPSVGPQPYRCRCVADLPEPVAAALRQLPDTAATPLSLRTPRRQVQDAYNRVSDVLSECLNLPEPGWRQLATCQDGDQITEALVAALQPAQGDRAASLCLQQTLLSRQSKPVRDFYRNRLMAAVKTPAGQLWPDFLLNGIAHEPPNNLPTCFLGEVKYQAKLNVPIAADYYLQPSDIDIDIDLLWNPGHHDQGGARVAHTPDQECDDIWHTSSRNGRRIHSAVQLDIYMAYPTKVLNSLHAAMPGYGLKALADHSQLRASGIFVDAWARFVDADTAYTHNRWTTATFASLLACASAHYFRLSQMDPSAEACAAVGLLASRLLYV